MNNLTTEYFRIIKKVFSNDERTVTEIWTDLRQPEFTQKEDDLGFHQGKKYKDNKRGFSMTIEYRRWWPAIIAEATKQAQKIIEKDFNIELGGCNYNPQNLQNELYSLLCKKKTVEEGFKEGRIVLGAFNEAFNETMKKVIIEYEYPGDAPRGLYYCPLKGTTQWNDN